ncbi:MAG: glycosyltransferase [Planctomycetota bacterium]
MLNVIQINASDLGGGVESVVRLHTAELDRLGHATQLLVGKKKNKASEASEIPYRQGPKGARRIGSFLEQACGIENLYSPSFRSIEESFHFRPDVIHLHSIHGANQYADLRTVARLCQSYPTVITLHDFWLMTGHCGYPLDCPRWKNACGSCPDLNRYPSIKRDATRINFHRKRSLFRKSKTELIVPSHWLGKRVTESPILKDQPLSVVFNPVDSDTFCPGPSEETRRRFGIREDEFVVMFIANNLSNIYKGIVDGIEALKHVRHPRTRVVIIGRTVEQVASQISAETIGLPYVSSPDELASYYRMADLLVMPSRCETFGLVAAESMACGTPVVSFDAGALAEVIGDEATGVVVPVRDPRRMAAEIDRFAEDPNRMKSVSKAAIERVRTRFSKREHTHDVTEVYRKAIQSHTSGRAQARKPISTGKNE